MLQALDRLEPKLYSPSNSVNTQVLCTTEIRPEVWEMKHAEGQTRHSHVGVNFMHFSNNAL
jgi:hypothetical protein